MSRLLPSEKFLSLPPSLAGRVGIVPALILCELSYRAGPRSESADLTKWVEASVASLRSQDCLWFVSEKTVKRALEALRKAGVIETRQVGGFDRSNMARIRLGHPALASAVDNSGSQGSPSGQNDPIVKDSVTRPSGQNDPIVRGKMAPSLLLESKNLEKNPERGNLAQKARVENPGSRNPEPELAPEVRAANLAKLRALVGLPSGQ